MITGLYYPWMMALGLYTENPGKFYDFYLDKCRYHKEDE